MIYYEPHGIKWLGKNKSHKLIMFYFTFSNEIYLRKNK